MYYTCVNAKKLGLRDIRGWVVEPMVEDGACLFRAIAFHVFGDQDMHGTVRDQCMDYMVRPTATVSLFYSHSGHLITSMYISLLKFY